MTRALWFAGGFAFVMASTACDPCAGMPSCHTQPALSATGQFIEFPSGRRVPGVSIAFARSGGAELAVDTIRAVSDGDGFFVLRAPALETGVVSGSLVIKPPPPHDAYVVPGVTLETHTKRGDGSFLGRLMVNPYLQFIGELHDISTFAAVSNATVTIRQFGPGIVDPPTAQFQSADNGRFMWEPTVVEFGPMEVEYEISAPGRPRTYFVRDTVPLQYRDEPLFVHLIFVGPGQYVGEVIRRGTKQYLSGVSVEFVRTGGIQASPDRFTAVPGENGRFAVPLELHGPGTLVGDLTIRPPAPIPTEVVRGVEIDAFDGGVRVFGPFGYGAAIIPRPVLVYRATGKPIRTGTHSRWIHVGGLPITPAPWGVIPDDGVRIGDSTGTVAYDAATNDTGTVLFDIEVRLNAPHAWETLRNVAFPSRFSDIPVRDTMRVGLWHPWTGMLRDAATNEPVSGATVTFRRSVGARTRPDTFTVVSDAAGSFAIRPEPLDSGFVDATLFVRAGGGYRDTTVSIRVRATQDDTLRMLLPIGLTRASP